MESKVKKSALSGMISGALASIIFQPLEFIKTKQQQPSEFHQIENLKSSSKHPKIDAAFSFLNKSLLRFN